MYQGFCVVFFFSSRRRHTRWTGDWSSDVCSSDLLRLNPRVLLLEEPSQGVDVGAKLEVHRQIVAAARAGAAVVVCSSEVEELVALCERVLVIRNGYVSDELTGSRVNVTDINLSLHAGRTISARGK